MGPRHCPRFPLTVRTLVQAYCSNACAGAFAIGANRDAAAAVLSKGPHLTNLGGETAKGAGVVAPLLGLACSGIAGPLSRLASHAQLAKRLKTSR